MGVLGSLVALGTVVGMDMVVEEPKVTAVWAAAPAVVDAEAAVDRAVRRPMVGTAAPELKEQISGMPTAVGLMPVVGQVAGPGTPMEVTAEAPVLEGGLKAPLRQVEMALQAAAVTRELLISFGNRH